jgi:hypothetical protein
MIITANETVTAPAFSGLAGEIVAAVAPTTESDPWALLATLLTAFGAMVGPGPHALGGGPQPGREFCVLVGRTAKARKGSSWHALAPVLAGADPGFVADRIVSGLATGEGLIHELAGREEGVGRSLLFVESEWGRTLAAAARSATLSGVLRAAWDGGSGDLRVLTRSRPLRASGCSVSLLAHITEGELRRRLSGQDVCGGLGNRFLYVGVKRAQLLPDGGGEIPADQLDVLSIRLWMAAEGAKEIDVLRRTPDAAARWDGIYRQIAADDCDDTVGSLLARADAHQVRLQVLYALLAGRSTIELADVEAAEAVWAHSAATVAAVFGGHVADPLVGQLLAALEEAGAAGLTGSQQRALVGSHVAGERLAAARIALQEAGKASTTVVPSGGRPQLVTIRVAAGAEHIEVTGSKATKAMEPTPADQGGPPVSSHSFLPSPTPARTAAALPPVTPGVLRSAASRPSENGCRAE